MNYVVQFFQTSKRAARIVWVGLLMALLASCGSLQDSDLTNQAKLDRFDRVAVIDIEADAVRGQVESANDGKIVVWRPEHGFAILGFTTRTNNGNLQAQSTPGEPNQDVFSPPEASAGGWTAWSGGWTAWSGGWTAWSGGWTAWSGGTESENTFGENLPLWDLINLPEAHALSTTFGKNVTVAVIDTGVDVDHPAFTCATLHNNGNCVSALAPSTMWADFVDNDNNPDEVPGAAYGHGTGVAGVILQMAPSARILPIRALGPDGSGDVAWVVSAIDHALTEGADIINLSLGTNVSVESLRAVLDVAASEGVYVFASAGNDNVDGATFPASLGRENSVLGSQLVGVSSVANDDLKSDFANYGVGLDMMAPGELIHTLAPDGQRGVWTGTSFSTPMTAGAMALALGEPAKNWKKNVSASSELNGSAFDIMFGSNNSYSGKLGSGRLDAEAFMLAVLK